MDEEAKACKKNLAEHSSKPNDKTKIQQRDSACKFNAKALNPIFS